MFRNTLSIIFLIVLSSAISNAAHAISCEDIITSSITLSSDLYCSTDQAALVVSADNVTIDLNGFTIFGIGSTVGIIASDKNNLTVTNGKFKGVNSGVLANRVTGLKVNNIVVTDSGNGVVGNSINNAIIENNIFVDTYRGVSIQNDQATMTANNNVIDSNLFYRSDTAIYICGNNADDNLLTNNAIWKSTTAGIRLIQSDRTQISSNTVFETANAAIALSSSSYSTINNNNLRRGSIGLSVDTNSTTTSCLGSFNRSSYKNVFDSNYSMEFEYGVHLGNSRKISTIPNRDLVLTNSVMRNKIYNNQVGIFFNTNARYNSTSNAFQGTITPIIDDGFGNRY
ncbi:right-handed parallel beta-helix repeat-containing protein [Arenicella sp.]|nr:right-handed parallel beta-helix repeat-containing protein [Arenicella sp.]